jgi:hypothetical protein
MKARSPLTADLREVCHKGTGQEGENPSLSAWDSSSQAEQTVVYRSRANTSGSMADGVRGHGKEDGVKGQRNVDGALRGFGRSRGMPYGYERSISPVSSPSLRGGLADTGAAGVGGRPRGSRNLSTSWYRRPSGQWGSSGGRTWPDRESDKPFSRDSR